MGEMQNRPFRLSFNAALKVGFQGSRVTSGGAAIQVLELDERLGFGELIAQYLADSGERMRNLDSPTCCGNQSIVAWLATKTSTTPRGLRRTRGIVLRPFDEMAE